MFEQTNNSQDDNEKTQLLFDNIDEENEIELGAIPEKFSEAVVWGTDWTTETIASQLEKGNIDLNPSFQRRDAWTDMEKSKLIESLILGIPIPSIILAENKNKKNSYIVIDGKQRLLSIRRFYSKVNDKEYKENFENNIIKFKQLKLTKLNILKKLNGKIYSELQNSDNYMTNLDNQSIRTIIIKNWPDEDFLYTIFLRLNTGSKKLSQQELRQALHPGLFLNYLDDVTANSKIIQQMLNNKSPDPRMRDIELSLRFFAYQYSLNDYKGNLKSFLDGTCLKLNNTWESDNKSIELLFSQFEKAIEFSMRIFPKKELFSRYAKGQCSNRFSRAIFDVFTYVFSKEEIRTAVDMNLQRFREDFIKLNDDIEFSMAVNDTTQQMDRVIMRFNKFFELINNLPEVKNQNIHLDNFIYKDDLLQIEKVTT